MFQALVLLLLSQFLQSWQQLERVPSVIIPTRCNFKVSSLLSIKKAKAAAHDMSKWASRASCTEQQAGQQEAMQMRGRRENCLISSFLLLNMRE